MKKYLIILALFIFDNLFSQGNLSYPSALNSTIIYTFTNLGESVSDLFIDPKIEERLIACNWPSDYGVKISSDNGENWTPAIINTSFFQYLRCTSLSFNPSNSDIGYLAAGIDLFKTINKGVSWDSTNMFKDFFDIRYVVYHPLNPQIIFVSNSLPYHNEVLLYKSIDGGNHWSISDSANYFNFLFPHDSQNVIYGLAIQASIRKSIDNGETWVDKNNNLNISYNRSISALVLSSVDPNVLYCGQTDDWSTDNWLLATTINGGEFWERIDSSLKEIDSTGSVNGILLDKNIEGRFFVSYTGGLYLIEDNGKHFQN